MLSWHDVVQWPGNGCQGGVEEGGTQAVEDYRAAGSKQSDVQLGSVAGEAEGGGGDSVPEEGDAMIRVPEDAADDIVVPVPGVHPPFVAETPVAQLALPDVEGEGARAEHC